MLESPPRVGRFRQGQSAGRPSVTVVHHLWLGSWETALAALTAASQNGMLSTNEAAAHKAVITAERKVVSEQLALLLEVSSFAVTRTTKSVPSVGGPL